MSEDAATLPAPPACDLPPALPADSGVTAETHAIRRAVADAVKAAGAVRYRHKRRAELIRECSSRAVGFRVGSAGATVQLARCRDRVCPTCGKINAAHVAGALRAVLDSESQNGERLLMFTLTLAHNRADRLKWLRQKLMKAWARLIRRKFWKEGVAEYHRVAEVELTVSGGWHPHLHVLVRVRRGSALYATAANKVQALLREQWLAITAKLGRPSFMADVRKVDPETVLNELVKYVTKHSATGGKLGQLGLLQYTPAQLDEYLLAVKGWRLHGSSRGWRSIEQAYEEQLDAQAPETGADSVEMTWTEVKSMAEAGADGALDLEQARAWKSTGELCRRALAENGCRAQAEYLRVLLDRFAWHYADTLAERAAVLDSC